MFSKLLIANRGEIAVRLIRTCHEMQIPVVALYEAPDQGSLHVRLAEESVLLTTPAGFRDQAAILQIAQDHHATAIHPGYGFFAEDAAFIRACTAAGHTFVGPSASVVAAVCDKLQALATVQAAGFPTVPVSSRAFAVGEEDALCVAAEALGYPLIIKSALGGRGRGARLVHTSAKLTEALHRAQAEAQAVYGNQQVYLEKALLPAHQIGVQIVGDQHGQWVHFGEREGSLISGNQKLLEEAPAPSLTPALRAALHAAALAIAQLFNYDNVGTVEFLVDEAGRFYFTEIKARIQMEHPATELVTRRDLVREQIRLAAGERLGYTQAEVQLQGHAITCRLSAEDPWHHFLPTPGILQRMRMPGGFEVRVDTFAYSGCAVPPNYDPLIAKLTAWGADRAQCVERLQSALASCKVVGLPSTLSVLQRMLSDARFRAGTYDSEFMRHPYGDLSLPDQYFRDLAVVAGILYARRTQALVPSTPDRLLNGWHHASRQLPQ